MKKAPVSHEEHLDEILKDPEQAAAYINAAIEENDPEAIRTALRNVTRARGVATIALVMHTHRENVSRMISPKGNPRLDNLLRILDALGYSLQVKRKSRVAA